MRGNDTSNSYLVTDISKGQPCPLAEPRVHLSVLTYGVTGAVRCSPHTAVEHMSDPSGHTGDTVLNNCTAHTKNIRTLLLRTHVCTLECTKVWIELP